MITPFIISTILGWVQNKVAIKQKQLIPDPRKVQRREIPFQTQYPPQFSNQFPNQYSNQLPNQYQYSNQYLNQGTNTQYGQPIVGQNPYFYQPNQPQFQRPQINRQIIRSNETEAERAERIHKSFERLLTFVEIVGQVDNYVSSKWKNLVKTVSNFYEVEDEPQRVSMRKIYGPCSK